MPQRTDARNKGGREKERTRKGRETERASESEDWRGSRSAAVKAQRTRRGDTARQSGRHRRPI